MHSLLRAGELQMLQARYGMIPLYLQRNRLPMWSDSNVLVTRNIREAKKVLITVHSP